MTGPNSTRRTAHLVSRVVIREQSHRRAVLIGIGTLLLLSMAPLFGHHVAQSADALLAGRDHIGALCLVALHYLLEPVHGLLHVTVLAGLTLALVDRVRAWYRLRGVLAPLRAAVPVPGDVLWGAAEAAWLDPRRVRVVSGLPNPAFTVGWLHPVVFVAQELAERLTHEELVAVLAHEAAHVRRRDPLRLSAIRFLARALFWLPALGRLAEDLADEAEIAADDAAAGERPLVLASALLAIADGLQAHPMHVAVTAACSGRRPDLLERRIRRLAGEDAPVHSHVTRRSVVLAGAALALVLVSSIAVVHPLPAQEPGARAHCMHEHSGVLSHLFCRAGAAGSHGDCPHAVLD